MFVHFSVSSPVVVLCSLLSSFLLFPPAVSAQMCGEVRSTLPNAPETGRTQGTRQQLITRGAENCPAPVQPLTALISPQASDYTFSAYPSFWFFVPFSHEQVEKLEFLLYDESEMKTIYRTQLRAPSQAGLIEVKIPEQAEYALKESQQYRWYFFLDCKDSPSLQPDLEVNGWITRRPLTQNVSRKIQSAHLLSTYLAYQNHNAWYDAVTYVAEILRANPDDPSARTIWDNLLACLQLPWVAQVPFVEEKPRQQSGHRALSE